MKVLITGATGFIGKHLVKALVEDGHYCRCLVRETSDIDDLAKLDNIELVYGDIVNKDSIEKTTKNIQLVYHLASQIGKHGVSEDQFYSTNINGTRNLLAASSNGDVKQFVFCSTPGVQGKGYSQASETLLYNPPHIYEQTKCEAERLVLKFHQERNLPVTIIRPDFVYGPGDLRRLSLYRAIRDKRFYVIGNGKSFLHPTYIDDVIQGFLLVANNIVAFGQIYNIAGPRPLTVEEYARTIAQTLNVTFPGIRVPKTIALVTACAFEGFSKISGKEPLISRSKVEFLTKSHGSDINKAKTQLGYEPKFEFEKGIRNTIDWYYKHSLL